MEGCPDCVTDLEFWGGLATIVVALWCTVVALRLWDGVRRDMRVKEWQKTVARRQRLREKEQKKLHKRVQECDR